MIVHIGPSIAAALSFIDRGFLYVGVFGYLLCLE